MLKYSDETIYELLQDAVGSGGIARGILETTRLVERHKARVVVIAANVMPPDRLDVIRQLCESQNVPILTVSDKKRLGAAAGLGVSASCIALTTELAL